MTTRPYHPSTHEEAWMYITLEQMLEGILRVVYMTRSTVEDLEGEFAALGRLMDNRKKFVLSYPVSQDAWRSFANFCDVIEQTGDRGSSVNLHLKFDMNHGNVVRVRWDYPPSRNLHVSDGFVEWTFDLYSHDTALSWRGPEPGKTVPDAVIEALTGEKPVPAE